MTKTNTLKTAAALSALLALWAAPALAETPAEMATAHFEAIAAANVGHAMAGYADDAVMQWVGGPLDGVYLGDDAILGVWMKFTGAQGPLKLDIAGLQTAANPKGATVTADVTFTGKAPIPVRYVLVYREGALVSETWQIAAQKSGY